MYHGVSRLPLSVGSARIVLHSTCNSPSCLLPIQYNRHYGCAIYRDLTPCIYRPLRNVQPEFFIEPATRFCWLNTCFFMKEH